MVLNRANNRMKYHKYLYLQCSIVHKCTGKKDKKNFRISLSVIHENDLYHIENQIHSKYFLIFSYLDLN